MKKVIYGLIVLFIFLSVIVCLSFNNKNKVYEEPKTVEIDNRISILLEKSVGSADYEESNNSKWPTSGYTFNETLSYCENDSKLTWNESTNLITVDTGKTDKCYVYFDKNFDMDASALATTAGLWKSTLTGDGYRYVGKNPPNYICFGTTSKDECVNNTDKYMYRIIGVFEDSGNKYMELIKKEALNTAMQWHSSYTDTRWSDSTLYSALNGSSFLTNTTYMPSGWSNRIKSWPWTLVNTRTYESKGLWYGGNTISNIYYHEIQYGDYASNCVGSDNIVANCGTGVWELATAKIGLMYVSDYGLSLGSEALNYTSDSNSAKLKTGWMHMSSDDDTPSAYFEWTMTRYGSVNTAYYTYAIFQAGNIGTNYSPYYGAVRPVFYLNSTETIKSGTGTLIDPYILS